METAARPSATSARLATRPWLGVRLDEWVGLIVLTCMVALSFQRLRIGVDLTDEAYHAVVTQRFALGDRPYIDEVSVRQTAYLLAVPFYWAYLKVAGSSDGVMYFMRLLFFALQLLTGLAAFHVTQRFASRATAYLAAALPITFMPFASPTWSYNTAGTLFFATGMFLGLAALAPDRARPRLLLIGAGAAHGLASLSYPPLAAAVLAFGACARWLLPAQQRLRGRDLAAYALPVVLVGCAIILPFAGNILTGREAAMTYEASLVNDRNFGKVLRILYAFVALAPWSPYSLVLALIALPVSWRLPALRKYAAVLALALTAVWFSTPHPQFLMPNHTLSLHAVIYAGLLAGPLLLASTRANERRFLLVCGFVPCAAAGVLGAFASGNVGCMNAGLGLLPAAVLALIAVAHAFEARESSHPAWLPLLTAAAVVLSMQIDNYSATYRDGHPLDDRREVSTGPFRGMLGLSEKSAAVEELSRALRKYAKPGAPLLAYYDFPAAYLMAPSRPALPTSWTDKRTNIAGMLPYYAAKRSGEGVAIVFPRESSVSPELERLVEDPARLLASTAWFRIYREPPP